MLGVAVGDIVASASGREALAIASRLSGWTAGCTSFEAPGDSGGTGPGFAGTSTAASAFAEAPAGSGPGFAVTTTSSSSSSSLLSDSEPSC